MKKMFAKIFSLIIILLGLTAGFFALSPKLETKAAGVINANATVKEIKNADELEVFIETYDAISSTANILLTQDIDMQGKTLSQTIGDETHPFTGVFDGQGYTIKNLTFDFSSVTATSKYIGLFGVTDGAIIKNLGIGDKTKVKVGNCTVAYVGNVVGKAIQTTLQYVSSTAEIIIQDNVLLNNLYLGGFVGYVNGGTLSHFISRTPKFSSSLRLDGKFIVDDTNNRTYNLGGAFGYVSNASVSFGIIASSIAMEVEADFKGKLNIGGLAGGVGQSSTKIFNCVVENTFDILDRNTTTVIDNIDLGQIIGVISSIAPENGNLACIYYKTNVTTANHFGSLGGYTESSADNIDSAFFTSGFFTKEEHFETKTWYKSTKWDFDKVWDTNNSGVILQSLSGDFVVTIGNGLRTGTIVECFEGFGTGTDGSIQYSKGFRYGAEVSFDFKFKKEIDGTRMIDMQEYFYLSSLTYNGGSTKIPIAKNDDGYYLTDTSNFVLSHTGDTYTLTIKSVNKSVASTFDFETPAKTFVISVTSRLYSDNTLVDDVIPAYVFYDTSENRYETKEEQVFFGKKQFVMDTAQKDSKLPYAFGGWYMKNESGTDTLISSDLSTRRLPISFGYGLFTDSCEIYARYNDDAYLVTFKLDAGVEKIVLSSREDKPITESNESEAISKKKADFKIEVYIKDGYNFDADWFVENICLFKSSGDDEGTVVEGFCRWTNKDDVDRDPHHFVFMLDMTKLSSDSVKTATINFSVSTTAEKKNNNAMIWYIVGGVGGAVVLAGIIILIVVLKKRNGGFGGGGSFGKNSYKDMYF